MGVEPSSEMLEFLRPLALALDAVGPGLTIFARQSAVHSLAAGHGVENKISVGKEVLRDALKARGSSLPEEVLNGAIGAAVCFQKAQGV